MTQNKVIKSYKELGQIFSNSSISDDVTKKLKEIHYLCQEMLKTASCDKLNYSNGNERKNYIAFVIDNKYSRPVNIELYEDGLKTDSKGLTKVDVFWENVVNNNIAAQSASDITSAIYVIAIGFCCCADLLGSGQKIAGTYFEKLIGHLYARHLNSEPVNQMTACELDDVTIKIPTDFIFDLGRMKPKFHVPVKTSTRDRVVQVWAQQRVLDGAYGVGRFICLLTCLSETDFDKEKKRVNDICVPGQWLNYQLFIAQMKRAYYLDIPKRYEELNNGFPKIHVKSFGEFFHEVYELLD
jgi:hypothetical protein